LKPGIYMLLVRLDKDFLGKISSLGTVKLSKGLYIYVGSARRGLLNRLKRYCLRNIRKLHWHIDYLLIHGEALGAYIIPSKHLSETHIVNALLRVLEQSIPRFGATDTKDPTHLFKYHREKFKDIIKGYKAMYISCNEILKCLNILS